jgi:NADP-dependent 3-hydroxy acid dehydrogenase YdfG
MTRTTPGVALVSGGGSGIGRAIALALAARGRPVALLGRRREPVEAALRETGGRGLALAVDVRDETAVAAAVARVEEEVGPIDVAVPAAGVARVAPFLELPAAAWRESLDTNLLGAANLFRACLPAMRARGRGHLLPILSVAARRGFPSWTAYCASKWGLAGLVAALREELAGSGVRISALVPGATDTGLWREVPGSWDRAAMIPVEQVARAAVWILEGDESSTVEELRLQPPGGDL